MDPDFPVAKLGTRVRIGLKVVWENLDSYLLIGKYLLWLARIVAWVYLDIKCRSLIEAKRAWDLGTDRALNFTAV